MTRRGMTLVELVLAITLTSMLSLALAGVMTSVALRLRERSERVSGEQALRTATASIRSGLESLGNDTLAGPDLLAATAAGFSTRAVRASGVACDVTPGLVVVRTAPGWWSALRDPVPGRDSVLIGLLTAKAWVQLSLANVASRACSDGAPGLALTVSSGSLSLDDAGPGSPVRLFEPIELRSYASSGDAWIGLRSLASSSAIQPLAGPLKSGGLTLAYLDSSGSATSSPAAVRTVSFLLVSLTERAGGVGLHRMGSGVMDSVGGFVAVRGRP